MAKVLRRHNLGTAKQRIAALASLTAADAGQVTEQALEGPFGFCLYAAAPGQVVALDTFYVGRLKGVGAVWQLTAVDVATRTAVVQVIVGDKTAAVAARFLDHLVKALRKHGITMSGVLTDIQAWSCPFGARLGRPAARVSRETGACSSPLLHRPKLVLLAC